MWLHVCSCGCTGVPRSWECETGEASLPTTRSVSNPGELILFSSAWQPAASTCLCTAHSARLPTTPVCVLLHTRSTVSLFLSIFCLQVRASDPFCLPSPHSMPDDLCTHHSARLCPQCPQCSHTHPARCACLPTPQAHSACLPTTAHSLVACLPVYCLHPAHSVQFSLQAAS